MKKVLVNVLSLSIVLMLLAGCAKPPQQEMDNAKAAIEAAKVAEADRYVPQEFKAAQDSLNSAMADVEKQNSKFALFRKYDKAKNLLGTVITMANTAKTNAEARKEQIKNEVQAALAEVGTLIQTNKELIMKAPKGKEGKAALEAIQNDLTIVESTVNEVNTLMTNGDFLTAQDKINAAKEKANAIKTELEDAIAKKKGGKK